MPATETRESSRTRTRKLIEAELMRLEPGGPLPPVRQLMKTHNVSLGRLQTILSGLEQSGLIERRARRGNFKASGTNLAQLTPFIDLVVVGDNPRQRPYHGSVIEAISEHISKDGQGLRLHRLSSETPIEDAHALTNRSDVRACILLAANASLVGAAFSRTPIASVCLLPKNDPHAYGCPCITTSADVTRLQLEHLWELGHTRIGFIDRYNPDNPVWSFLIRREAYFRLMAERGQRIESHWVAQSAAIDRDTHSALAQMFDHPQPPTAVIVSDVQLAITYRFLASRGLRVGHDVSVIGTDGLPDAMLMDPPATTVSSFSSTVAKLILETLRRLCANQPVDHVQAVTPELIVRESTASPTEINATAIAP